MGISHILLRCLFTYLFLLLLLRMSGKRSISEATPFDFVVTLILGDLIDDALFAEVPFAHFIVAAGMIVLAETIVSFFAFRSDRFFLVVNGIPRLLLENGKKNESVMKKEQMIEADLKHLTRSRGIDKERWNEIKLGALEKDGTISLLRESKFEKAQKQDKPRLREKIK